MRGLEWLVWRGVIWRSAARRGAVWRRTTSREVRRAASVARRMRRSALEVRSAHRAAATRLPRLEGALAVVRGVAARLSGASTCRVARRVA